MLRRPVESTLDAPIGVVHQSLAGLPVAQGHFQRLTDLGSFQPFMYVPAHDLAGIGIRYQAQVSRLFFGRQVRNIGHPQLFAAARRHLGRGLFEQVGMTPEAMVAVSCLVVRPLGQDQHPFVTQEVEQSITTELDARVLQRRLQDEVQLACADARLLPPLLIDHGHHAGPLLISQPLTGQGLVMRLPADTHVLASPHNAQPLDKLFLEDLPAGFFVTVTP